MGTTSPRRSRIGRRIGIAVAAAAVLVAGVVGVASQTGSPSTTPSAPSAQSSEERSPLLDLPRRVEGDPLAMGEVDAPVVLIEFADFTCTYCSAFAVETLPAIVQRYVDAGQLRIEWHHTPVLSDDSATTSIAAQAAAQQGRFWEYSEALYARTFAGGATWDRATFVDIATGIDGIDVAAFEEALDDPGVAATVQQHSSVAQQLGVRSTPTFVIGSQVVSGAQPLAAFEQVIEAELAAAT